MKRTLTRGPRRARQARDRGRGIALVEFALILPILIILVLATVDFGRLIQTRLILSNVSREGGSLASRQTVVDTSLVTVLSQSGMPLNFGGPYGKIFITRISAGTSAGAPNPTITSVATKGGLAVTSKIGAGNPNLGLTRNVYNHLVFNSTNATSDIAEVTVVEVYYKYRPITPLPKGFMYSMLTPNTDGLIVMSKAVF